MSISTAIGSLGLLSLLGLVAATLMGCGAFNADTPEYKVTQANDGFELRQYGAELVAETTVSRSDQRAATSEGFRRLAGYIFGGNTAVTGGSQKVAMTSPVEARPAVSQKIAMTAPVEARPDPNSANDNDGGTWVITFILPSDLTLKTAPRPNDARVTVRERQGQLMAVHRFNGRMNAELYAAKKKALLDSLATAGIEPTGPVTAAQYDHPGVMAQFRRNEVMVPVAQSAKP